MRRRVARHRRAQTAVVRIVSTVTHEAINSRHLKLRARVSENGRPVGSAAVRTVTVAGSIDARIDGRVAAVDSCGSASSWFHGDKDGREPARRPA